MAYTDYQQRALYGSGQDSARAGQRFHMEANALQRGDVAAAKYHRSRANALNKQGAYSAVRGLGGEKGPNQYFATTSSGQPVRTTAGDLVLLSAGRDVFDKFRDKGFVEPIRQKRRYAPNTEPQGLGSLVNKIGKKSLWGQMLSGMLPQKAPEEDDPYYQWLWGRGLNEQYGDSGIFSSGEFLGDADIDPYYRKNYTGPKWLEPYLKPFTKPRADSFDVVRDSSIPEDLEFMQETPRDYSGFMEPENYDDRWEKYQLYLNDPSSYPQYEDFGQIETGEGIPKVRNEMEEFMSGNIGALNPLQPNNIFEKSTGGIMSSYANGGPHQDGGVPWTYSSPSSYSAPPNPVNTYFGGSHDADYNWNPPKHPGEDHLEAALSLAAAGIKNLAGDKVGEGPYSLTDTLNVSGQGEGTKFWFDETGQIDPPGQDTFPPGPGPGPGGSWGNYWGGRRSGSGSPILDEAFENAQENLGSAALKEQGKEQFNTQFMAAQLLHDLSRKGYDAGGLADMSEGTLGEFDTAKSKWKWKYDEQIKGLMNKGFSLKEAIDEMYNKYQLMPYKGFNIGVAT